MTVVGYGGGTDSTAMLVGLWQRQVPVDLILFADPGGEQPHTYEYLEIMEEEKLVSGLHCEPETVKEEMQATKELWGKTDGRTYKPVSYTHLDVYKRQPISIMCNPTMRTRK